MGNAAQEMGAAIAPSSAYLPRASAAGDSGVFPLPSPPSEGMAGANVATRPTPEGSQVLNPSLEDFTFFLGEGTGRTEEEAQADIASVLSSLDTPWGE